MFAIVDLRQEKCYWSYINKQTKKKKTMEKNNNKNNYIIINNNDHCEFERD